jgi:ribonuclease-3
MRYQVSMKRLIQHFFLATDRAFYSTACEKRLGYRFKNPSLLALALTHRSFYNENPHRASGHNERLEFLGDAALGLAISTRLMNDRPEANEGLLTRWRAALVNEETLAKKAVELGLDRELRLGRGEEKTEGRQKPRLLACVYEAVVGALYVEGGFATVEEFIYKEFEKDIVDLLGESNSIASDYKTQLQEKIQAINKKTPIYRSRGDQGPDHEKIFLAEVCLDDRVLGYGEGRTKKQAEQMAAKVALESGNG